MAKRRTYEQKLLDDLLKIPANKWFNTARKTDKEFAKFIATVGEFIFHGHPFELNREYTKIRRNEAIPYYFQTDSNLPADYRLELTEKGLTEQVQVKNKNYEVDVPQHYRIYKNGILIGIESIIKKKNGK